MRFACDLSAIPAADRTRYHQLKERLQGALISRQKIAGGYALSLDEDLISRAEVFAWVAMERVCCPWLSIETQAGLKRTVELRVRAPEQAEQVITEEFAELLNKTISEDEVL